MAFSISFQGITLWTPGAYTTTRVAQSAPQDAQLGVVALIGESDEGPAWAAETTGLAAVTFTSGQFADIQQKYGSGRLVDMARLALTPSDDDSISGGAQTLVLMKTNQSVAASLTLSGSYGAIAAKKAGAPGNNTSVQITGGGSTRVITIARADLGLTEVSGTLGNTPVITLQCTDGVSSAATLTVSATAITTTITGGSTQNLNIPIGQFQTIQQLVDYINTIPNYTATVATPSLAQQPLTTLDRVTAVNILVAASVKRDSQDIRDFFSQSQLVNFTPGASGYTGLPTAITTTFLSSGAKGGTSQAQFQTALDALGAANINFVTPLMSQDASADITAGQTDPSSTYTIDAINAAVRSHVAQQSTIKGRRERQGFCSAIDTSYTVIKNKAAALGAARVSLCFQEVLVSDATGTLSYQQPFALATINAGMKAAAPVGLPNTNKLINISGFKTRNASGAAYFDPATQSDDAIQANLTFVQSADSGFEFVLDNSTYGLSKDAWYYSRPAVIYASDVAARTLRLNVQRYVGSRNSDISTAAIASFISAVCDQLRAQGVLVADAASNGRGYTDIAVTLTGNVVNFSVNLVLVEGIEFVLGTISVTRASA
jgi:hypothetical protein